MQERTGEPGRPQAPARAAEPLELARDAVPRWVVPLLALVAVGLVPWTLWLTFTLPARHVTEHYDLAWVGFDIALAAAFSASAWAAVRSPRWLVPLAAATATMLVCDAWFDIVTSSGRGERMEAVLEALFAELPLAALCTFIVLDAERFRRIALFHYGSAARRAMRAATRTRTAPDASSGRDWDGDEATSGSQQP